jgi:hypothetical protein
MNGMYRTSEPIKPGFEENLKAFGRRLMLVLFLAAGAAGVVHLYRNGQVPLLDRAIQVLQSELGISSEPSSSPQAATPETWSRQDLAELSLEAPFTLARNTPTNQGLNSFQTRQITQRYDWSAKAADGFQVEVLFLQIDGTHTLSLEDGVKGLVRSFAMRAGDSNPVYRSASVFVNGLPSRRISYESSGVHMEALVVQASRKAMGVVVGFRGDARTADAERILDSVTVRAGY